MIASVARSQRPYVLFQFIRFGMVGGLGFLVDTLVVYGLRSSLGLYAAGLVSYIVAASFTWMLNRLWTFRGLSTGSALRQWGLFMLANLSGFVLNRGTYAILVTVWALAAENPIIATAAGAIAGMFVNFRMSRRLVFR
jgi:putative flippase GtrA